jgi:hypothetical protein
MRLKLHHQEDLTQLQQQSRRQRDAKQRDREWRPAAESQLLSPETSTSLRQPVK